MRLVTIIERERLEGGGEKLSRENCFRKSVNPDGGTAFIFLSLGSRKIKWIQVE
jgi:hypothetical protein